MNGHIKLDRKILSWEWYSDANTFRLFIHLLLTATHKDGRFRGMTIKRGEVVTGRLKLASALRLSEKQIRVCLDKLKTTNEIAIRTTNRFSIITICKYDYYQSQKNILDQPEVQQKDQQVANEGPTEGQQRATFKNVKNVKNVNEGDFPKLEEVERVFQMQGGTKEMAEAFFNSYSATNWLGKGGQPIVNFNYLVGGYITTWHQIKNKETKSAPLKVVQPKIRLA